MEEHAKDIHSRPRPRCPECGKGIQPAEKVCRNCGANLVDQSAEHGDTENE